MLDIFNFKLNFNKSLAEWANEQLEITLNECEGRRASRIQLRQRLLGHRDIKILQAQGRYSCVICMDLYECGDIVKSLGCQHLFHGRCIDQWINEYSDSCPLCRKNAESNNSWMKLFAICS
jgi:hypothetical protein